MADPVIRPQNGLLLIAPQSAEGTAATLDPALHAVPIEADSFSYGNPFTSEDSNETNGSLVQSAPLIVGQAVPLSFQFRLKGAGAGTAYTSSVKPPHHAVYQACGLRGFFQAAIAAVALTAGTTTSATLGTGFAATAQLYRGMPLVLSGGPGAGLMPFVTDYTAGKVATLSDLMPQALTTSTLAAIPANWTYAGTTPLDAASRLTDHPPHTVGWYEDGNFYQWIDVRGVLDLEGRSARPGTATVRMQGTFTGSSTVAMPTNAILLNHSAPILTKGAGSASAIQVMRKELPISAWSLRNGGDVEGVDDPNTAYGFGPGQIGGRKPVFGADPLATLVSTQDQMGEVGAGATGPIALRLGQAAGNRVGILGTQAQPIKADPAKRLSLRSLDREWQLTSPGRDAQLRDSERFLIFS
jgi:hypothetical protein